MGNTMDIELGNIDSDKALAIEIKHDDSSTSGRDLFLSSK